MKICPKCKNEYREGITHCADCGVELVEEGTQKEAGKILIQAAYPVVSNIYKYLEYCKFTTLTVEEPDEEGNVVLKCSAKEYKEAYKQMNVFIAEENKKAAQTALENLTDEDMQEMEEAAKEAPPSNVYVNYKSKAEENKSSAFSFLIIGVLGIIMVVLSWFEYLPFSIGGRGNWFSHGAMFIFFVLFVVVGVISAKNVNKYKELADSESDDQNQLEKYLTETFTEDVLNGILADTEEEAYFKRMKYMRDNVSGQFPELAANAEFVESLLDMHYDKLFG